ncbi:MAG: MotA/TolQ/ExbB proton channel family protein [Salibaculum sp.]|jgi:biopolymer transport protein ExbB|uniref:MotA/TolQ/ExbB proton channel family protein n=1 Tax=Salibaculum sp. TaxID=2855480 RepID=UPI00287063A6|nr:MotA/TolQ/ExbB proton channel family protein [Salibaculum sp.]MDR9428368.1 MotA/TolQ/ExbB proton channel family protein [Salibaculum sp.]MDR9483424.1 MotA/TolQ/ExbB proton channel family protein [Salibaculum sp.]
MTDLTTLTGMLARGGPALWLIAGLSVLTLALVLWKIWRLSLAGAWGGRRAEAVVARLCAGKDSALPERPRTVRLRFVTDSWQVLHGDALGAEAAREEITRLAQRTLSDLRGGLRPLELIATIAPLIGLLGTVLGMIEAFQALQDSGAQADAGVLAGGIWEALLTTAAGMAVAIPATIAQSWFESVAERVRLDMEDHATRLVIHAQARRGAVA